MPKRATDACGGRHQKRRRAEETAAGPSDWPEIAGISPLCWKLLEKWCWGHASAVEICDIARAACATFQAAPKDVQTLAACGSAGHSPQNTQRDLLRALQKGQETPAPEPYVVSAHVVTQHGVELADLSIFYLTNGAMP